MRPFVNTWTQNIFLKIFPRVNPLIKKLVPLLPPAWNCHSCVQFQRPKTQLEDLIPLWGSGPNKLLGVEKKVLEKFDRSCEVRHQAICVRVDNFVRWWLVIFESELTILLDGVSMGPQRNFINWRLWSTWWCKEGFTSFGNRNFMQSMGRLSMHSKCIDLFLLSWEVGFFSFCSQHVPFKFPMGSQYIPMFPMCSLKGLPNST
jgi:hypothetical protein